ncbi:hypothetical protein RCC89_19840 [Cytophagaceae bacterium ABcell3]|nr:hypothetical protein RCC89_19840 [Cytophagaceae bacterium ABcell3]
MNLRITALILVLLTSCESFNQEKIESITQGYSKDNFRGLWQAQLINTYEISKENDSEGSLVDYLSAVEFEEEIAIDSLNFNFFKDSVVIIANRERYKFYYEIDTTYNPKITLIDKGQLSILDIEKFNNDTIVLRNMAISTERKEGKRFIGSHYLLTR